MTVVLLGTGGGPVMWRGRSGISTAVIVEDRIYLVDLGIGAMSRYREAGLFWSQLSDVFITHMHSDHTLDLPHALMVPWDLPNESYTAPIRIWGPGPLAALPDGADRGCLGAAATPVNPDTPYPGIGDMVHGLLERVFQGDINVRMVDEGRSDPRRLFRATDLKPAALPSVEGGALQVPDLEPFPVMEDDRVKVTATLVDHRLCVPAYAYRLDSDHGSVVVSGDTAPTDNLLRLSEGADVLFHEAIHLDELIASIPAGGGLLDELVEHWKKSHTLHTVVGRVAAAANVRSLVLTHLAPGHVNAVSDGEWEHGARRGFRGWVHAGRDLDALPAAPHR